jgi:sugar phosphate permease
MAETTVKTYKSHSGAWTALLMGALFYCFQFLVRVSPDVMTEELMASFAVDAAGLSFILMWYYAAYSGMQVPLGLVVLSQQEQSCVRPPHTYSVSQTAHS